MFKVKMFGTQALNSSFTDARNESRPSRHIFNGFCKINQVPDREFWRINTFDFGAQLCPTFEFWLHCVFEFSTSDSVPWTHCVSLWLGRFYFKKVSDEFDCGVVFEEVRDDDAVLPIFEEKIIGKVEKVDWHLEVEKVQEREIPTSRWSRGSETDVERKIGGNREESETEWTQGKKKLNYQGRDEWRGKKKQVDQVDREGPRPLVLRRETTCPPQTVLHNAATPPR